MYLRIFTGKTIRIITYVMMFAIIANWISFIVASSLQCVPFNYQWDKTIPGGHCFNIQEFYKVSSAPNIATDAIIMALPMPMVWTLKASVIRKVGLMLVFLAGSV